MFKDKKKKCIFMIQIENGEENHKQQFTLKTLNMYIHAQKPE